MVPMKRASNKDLLYLSRQRRRRRAIIILGGLNCANGGLEMSRVTKELRADR